MIDVVGLGACNIDFITRVSRFVEPDDEVDVEKLIISGGGSASNFTVGLSRLNIKSGIIARVGDDYFGRWSLEELKKEGVDAERLLMIDEPTGMVFIAVDPHGERSMYTFIGANRKFHLKKEDIEYIKASKILHITQMYKKVVEDASKHANLLSLSPGAILSSFGIDSLAKIIKKAHMIFLNKKELSLLTGADLKEGVRMLLDLGVGMVIVTLGGDGANLYTEEGMIHSPAKKVKIVDTTGAGDAFAAGFVASFIKGRKLKDCLDFANLIASHCVEKFGARGIPRLNLNSKKF